MQAYKYLGPPANIGRFGSVNTGDILDLRLGEEKTVQENPEWERVNSRKDTEPVVALRGAPLYDLRDIDWSDAKLEKYFRNRNSLLRRIGNAMVQIGCNIIVMESHTPADLIDVIMREGYRNGWDKLTKEERRKLPEAEEDGQEFVETEGDDLLSEKPEVLQEIAEKKDEEPYVSQASSKENVSALVEALTAFTPVVTHVEQKSPVVVSNGPARKRK